jgi:K+-sensing histidine kinase KdpD
VTKGVTQHGERITIGCIETHGTSEMWDRLFGLPVCTNMQP